MLTDESFLPKDSFPKAKAETTGKYLDSFQVVSLSVVCGTARMGQFGSSWPRTDP